MTWRADRDGLDHSWARSGLSDPPPFGESLPPEWLDVELNFYRRTGGSQNDIGGFKGTAAPVNFLVILGHMDLEVDSGLLNEQELGIFVRRHYVGQCLIPDDLANLPRKGDRVWWIDPLGRRIDVAIRSVDSPEGLRDHLEIESEEFE